MAIVLSIPFYILLLLCYRRIGILNYYILTTGVYLVSLSFIQTLDVTLPIYIVFTAFPLVSKLKIKKNGDLLLLFYFTVVLVFSIIENGIKSALSIFIIRLIGVFMFILLYQNIPYKTILRAMQDEKRVSRWVILTVITEGIIFALGVTMSTDSRLMLNSQCTVGCISVGTMLFLSYLLSISKYKKTIWGALIFLFLTSALSGTRGYIIITGGILMVSIVDYVDSKRIMLLGLIGCFVCLFLGTRLAEYIAVNMRFGLSTGRRSVENKVLFQFIFNQPLHNVLLGHGFGTPFSKYPSFEPIVSSIPMSSYVYYVLHRVSWVHNNWFTTFYASGLIGFGLIVSFFRRTFRNIIKHCADKRVRRTMIVYLLLYIVLLWYRWAATSGVLEFFMFAVVLILSSNNFSFDEKAAD